MTKQQWITEQIANYPNRTASNICSELNKISLVNNPVARTNVPYPVTVDEVSDLLVPATRFAVQNTQTWQYILSDLQTGEDRWFVANLDNLLGGNKITQTEYDDILELLQTAATRTQLDPNYQTQVRLSPAQIAGYDYVATHEIQEVIDAA